MCKESLREEIRKEEERKYINTNNLIFNSVTLTTTGLYRY